MFPPDTEGPERCFSDENHRILLRQARLRSCSLGNMAGLAKDSAAVRTMSTVCRAIFATWHITRFALAAVLLALEPVVTAVLATLALLGLGAALLFHVALPNSASIHISILIGGAAGCLGAIFLYVALIAILQRPATSDQ